MIRVLALLGSVLVLAGCGGESAADPLADATTDPVTVAGTSSETALLSDVEASEEDGYDRLVFTFQNVVPGYDVRYVDRPVLADGSGNEVTVDGDAVLQVRMEPALDADLNQEDAPATYTGPNRFSPETEQVIELVRIGGFEAVLTWVAGVGEQADFQVSTLADPPRLVIDVRQ